jgi:DNA-binding transcriptional ArsR family regulator
LLFLITFILPYGNYFLVIKGETMKLKLQLLGNGKVLFEMPLSCADWPRGMLEDELSSMENEFERLSKIFMALSNETRFLMMKQLMVKEDHIVNFTDFMRGLDLNPKLVRDNARKLSEGGLVEKVGRGRYRCSEFGEPSFMMMSLALRHLMRTLDEL